MKVHHSDQQSVPMIDLTEIYLELKEKYTEVFMFQVDNQVFLYKQLGRKDYKDLLEAECSDYEKEELICKECVLFPENYDFEECDAGIPTQLTKTILKNSFLDSLESRQLLINVFRQEMYEMDNQITCLIHEAFPEYDIEEIETWDLQRTAKYLSRAEWILANLRGAVFSHDPFTGKTPEEILQEQEAAAAAQAETTGAAQTTEMDTTQASDEPSPISQGIIETIEERQARLKKQGISKQKMTPEKLKELQMKYPEMDWGANVFEEVTIDSLKDSVSVESPALRPGF